MATKKKKKKSDIQTSFNITVAELDIKVKFEVGFLQYAVGTFAADDSLITIYSKCPPSDFIPTLIHELNHVLSSRHHFQYWFIELTADPPSLDKVLTLLNETHSIGGENAIHIYLRNKKLINQIDKEYKKFYKQIGLPALKEYLDEFESEEERQQELVMLKYGVK
jgi:hypothetical protein